MKDVQILDPTDRDEYAALDQLIGLCETKQTDASVDNDAIVYGRKDGKELLRELPFSVKVPNEETIRAIEESGEVDKLDHFENVNELYEDMKI